MNFTAKAAQQEDRVRTPIGQTQRKLPRLMEKLQ